MGERQSDGRAPGRRAVPPVAARPDTDGSGPAGADAESSVEALLAAVRSLPVDPGAEMRAVAAFRAAREQGAHAAPARRRDDWRPREQRRARRSLRTVLATLIAGLTLGGVAVAAIGPGGLASGGGADRGEERPAGVTADPSRGRTGTTPAPGSAAPSGRPSTAQDTEARCRAYEAVGGRGRALGATAWRRLIDEAGGAEKVEAYCAERGAGAKASAGSAGSGRSGKGDGGSRSTPSARAAVPTRAGEPGRTGSARPEASRGAGKPD